MSPPHRVVIVGGGFGGLYAAQRLGRAPVPLTVVDRGNFHLFQPCRHPTITSPLRHMLSRQRNTEVLTGEVVDFDVDRRRVILGSGELPTTIWRWPPV